MTTPPTNTPVRCAPLKYMASQRRLVPIEHKAKYPFIWNLQNLRITAAVEQPDRPFNPGMNLGQAYGRLKCVDRENDPAVELVAKFLPNAGLTKVSNGYPSDVFSKCRDIWKRMMKRGRAQATVMKKLVKVTSQKMFSPANEGDSRFDRIRSKLFHLSSFEKPVIQSQSALLIESEA